MERLSMREKIVQALSVTVCCLFLFCSILSLSKANASPPDDGSLFFDNFSTDSTGDYTVTGDSGTQFLYDGVFKRAQVHTGDNKLLNFSHSVTSLATGTFRIDFLPTQKYPFGGLFIIRLKEDANNYYEISQTDGYGPEYRYIKKFVGGVEVDSATFSNPYTQNNNYHVSISFSPGQTTVEAFGQILTINTNTDSISVNSFEVESFQQSAYVDNISYADTVTPDTAPPIWDGAEGICSASNNPASGTVTAQFGAVADAVDGSNVKFNIYYAPSTSWNNSDWSQNSSLLDVSPKAGATCFYAYTVKGLQQNVEYTFGVRVSDQADNEDDNTNTATAIPAVTESQPFFDKFNTDSTGDYTVTEDSGAQFLYEGVFKRAQVHTGDNKLLNFSHNVTPLETGTFRIDFLPTQKYPFGGLFIIRLKEGANKYYEISQTDGYGPEYRYIKKFVGGVKVDSATFSNSYTQNNSYYISISFSPGLTTVEAFGQTLTINTNTDSILVTSFEVELFQQDAYLDNVAYYSVLDPFVKITQPFSYYLQHSSELTVRAIADNLQTGWGIRFVLDSGTPNEQNNDDYLEPYEAVFTGLDKSEHTVDAYVIDDSGSEISGENTHDQEIKVGIGNYYVATGDSITAGDGDDNPSDDISTDGRNSRGGFEPILNDLLTYYEGYPHTVINEGVGGATSANGVSSIQALLSRHPDAQYFLVLFGTNDSRNDVSTPSGLGLNPVDLGYTGSYKDNMQQIITAIAGAGKIPILAKVPIVYGPCSTCDPFPDPLTAPRNLLIQEYNQVIEELVAANSLEIEGPDFYQYFKDHPEEYIETTHPNGIGYQSMAYLWFNAIKTYTITATAGSGGGISPSGAVSGNYGEDQSFTITPNTGYHIGDVKVDGISVGAVASYQFSNVTANHTITATFAIDTHTVTPSAGANGSISPSTPQTVNYGSTTSFTVTPNTGYHTVSVTGCGGTWSGTNPYTTGPITANCTVTATFAIDTHTVTPSAGPNGSIDPSTPQIVSYGSTVEFTMSPDEGYYIAGVTSCGGTLSGNKYTTAPITADCSVTATFASYTAVKLLSPNSEAIRSGSSYDITWQAPPNTTIQLFLSLDNGVTWSLIKKDISGTTSYNWTVPAPLGNKKGCLVKVIGYNASNVKVGVDKSDAPFTIEVVKLTYPNGGDTFAPGDPLTITWTTNGTKKPIAGVRLYYTIDGGLTWLPIITLKDPVYTATGEHSFDKWIVPKVIGNKRACKVKVMLIDASGNILGQDASDSYFTIEVVRVTSPNGGEELTSSSNPHTITWTTNDTKKPVAKVRLEFTNNGGLTWLPIITLKDPVYIAPGPHSYGYWTVPAVNKPNCKVRVTLIDTLGNILAADVSDSTFTIKPQP